MPVINRLFNVSRRPLNSQVLETIKALKRQRRIMAYNNERLNQVYDKTDGRCHICHKKLSFCNHGTHGAKGSWHVEHSVPKAKGGSDHLNNLFPACIDCNIEKSTSSTRTARAWKGNTRAPYSKAKKQTIQDENTAIGATIGGAVGLLFGPIGAIIGATIGGAIGNSNSPKR